MPRLGAVPVAAVELRRGPSRSRRRTCSRTPSATLARYELPAEIRIVDELPAPRRRRSTSPPSARTVRRGLRGMDLRYSREDEAFRAEVRAWLEVEVPAHGPPPPPGDWPARRAYDTAWQRKLYDAGYAGLAWPSAFGGRGLPDHPAARLPRGVRARRRAVHRRQLRRPDARRPHLDRRGQRRAAPFHLPRILKGESVWCQGFSEPAGRARISPRCARGPCVAATSTSSAARRSGARAPTSPTTASSSCAPTPMRRSTRASPGSSSTCTSRA